MDTLKPKSVAQRLLDVSGIALMSGDFEMFERCFALPKDIETSDGRRTLHTRQELKEMFEKVHRRFKEMNVTDIVRHCNEATLRADGTIAASHETRLVNNNELVQQPYPCLSVISRVEGQWKVSAGTYAIIDNPRQIEALS